MLILKFLDKRGKKPYQIEPNNAQINWTITQKQRIAFKILI